jgi:hypothetical protein
MSGHCHLISSSHGPALPRCAVCHAMIPSSPDTPPCMESCSYLTAALNPRCTSSYLAWVPAHMHLTAPAPISLQLSILAAPPPILHRYLLLCTSLHHTSHMPSSRTLSRTSAMSCCPCRGSVAPWASGRLEWPGGSFSLHRTDQPCSYLTAPLNPAPRNLSTSWINTGRCDSRSCAHSETPTTVYPCHTKAHINCAPTDMHRSLGADGPTLAGSHCDPDHDKQWLQSIRSVRAGGVYQVRTEGSLPGQDRATEDCSTRQA